MKNLITCSEGMNWAKSLGQYCSTLLIDYEKAYDRIEKGQLDELVISDTIPTRKNAKKITVLTASTMIGEAIRRIHNNESVNSIFTA